MAPYKLYWRKGSATFVAEAALRMVGANYELIEIADRNDQRSAEFRAINPAGKIPVLITPDGHIVFETMAILLTLDERHKGANLLPAQATDERAIALQWLAFLATSSYSSALRFYYPERFTADQTPEAVEAVKIQSAIASDADFAILSAALKGPFLLGDTLTITDIYLAMIADWHEPAMELPAIQELKATMLKNKAIKAAWDNHEYGNE
jgi:glutathione S-transferase